MLPKGFYVVVDCTEEEPGKYRVLLNRTFKLPRGHSNNLKTWSPCEGIIAIHLTKDYGNILEVSTDWVDADTHYPRLSDDDAKHERKTVSVYYSKYGIQVCFSEPEILSVGSVISTVSDPLLVNVVEECRADIERILKKFKVTDHKTPDNGQQLSEDQAGVVRKQNIRFCLMNQTVQYEENSV